MASLQRYKVHGHTYWRIVESYRRADGHPTTRTLQHLGRVDDLLGMLAGQRRRQRLRSVSSGAVDALCGLAAEFDVAGIIDRAILEPAGKRQRRDGLSAGQSLALASIARVCHPSSKRAVAAWAKGTSLPARFGVEAEVLTSQHFWDQMHAMPLAAVAQAEEALVQRVLAVEKLSPRLLAYDTTNFYTHIASTNLRPKLPERGHNKQRRHDLRQMGLALVVSEEGQIPLGHVLYRGARPDVKTLAEELAPLRARLRRILGEAAQLTLVFDQGGESAENLQALREGQEHYVTALKPSHHRALLAEASRRLEPVQLPSGETVRALRLRHAVHGVEHTVVVVHSPVLAQGQSRGLDQHLSRALARLAAISPHPRDGLAGARRQAASFLRGQYVRQVLSCEVSEQDGVVAVRPSIDPLARQRIETEYFGLRVLATTRDEMKTEEIVCAYRGQAHVERAFRDLKDPWVCALRPQFHWTDQKLVVHAFVAVVGLILARVLLRRAQREDKFQGTLRTLIQRLDQIRTCTVVELGDKGGRPRVRQQLEECEPALLKLGKALNALPAAEAEGASPIQAD